MLKWYSILLLVMLISVPVHGAPVQHDPADCDGCNDPALFSRMPGFHIYNAQELELARFEFPVAPGRVVTLEGRYHYVDYYANDGIRKPSGLQVIRNYVSAAQAAGGELVYEFEDGGTEYATLKVVKNGSEVWTSVHGASNGMYNVTVVTLGAPGRVEPPSVTKPQRAVSTRHASPLAIEIIQDNPKGQVYTTASLIARYTGGSGDAVTFQWSQTDGPPLRFYSPAVPIQEGDWKKPMLQFYPTEPATYGFTVTVTSGQEQASSTTSVTVPPPVLTARIQDPIPPPAAGLPYGLTAFAEGGIPVAPYTYEWKQLPGKAISPSGGWNHNILAIPAGVLSTGETYEFSVTITLGQVKASSTISVTVTPPPPISVRIQGSSGYPVAGMYFALAAFPEGIIPPDTTYSYEWKQVSGEALVPSHGWNQNLLVIPPGVLSTGASYEFQVTVRAGDAYGTATFIVGPVHQY